MIPITLKGAVMMRALSKTLNNVAIVIFILITAKKSAKSNY